MTSRATADYVAVMEAIISYFDGNLQVSHVMLDFEMAVWNAFAECFPNVQLHGCSFHFTQAIFRKVQSLGMQVQYQENVPVRKFIRKLMALCFLPHHHVASMFAALQQQVSSERLEELCSYIKVTWLDTWKPQQWSIYGMPIRTNNDVEGWHHKINRRSRHSTPFYLLLQVLHEEANDISTSLELLDLGLIKRRQRKMYRLLHKRIFKYWNQYENGQRNAKRLLDSCAHLVSKF